MLEQSTFRPQDGKDGFKSWTDAGRQAVMRHDPDARTAGPVPTFSRFDLGLTNSGKNASLQAGLGETPSAPASKDEPYSFADVLDIVNPLQHLPFIGTFYRQLTGDTIKGMSAILGGALFGGPVGAVVSTADVIVRDRTGMDAAENLMAFAGFGSAHKVASKPDISYGTAQRPLGNNTDANFSRSAVSRLEGSTVAFADLKRAEPNGGRLSSGENVSRWNS